MRSVILDLFAEHGVEAMFAGHWHRNNIASTAGAFDMVVSGPVGVPLGDDPSGFRVVRVLESGLDHTLPRPRRGRLIERGARTKAPPPPRLHLQLMKGSHTNIPVRELMPMPNAVIVVDMVVGFLEEGHNLYNPALTGS